MTLDAFLSLSRMCVSSVHEEGSITFQLKRALSLAKLKGDADGEVEKK